MYTSTHFERHKQLSAAISISSIWSASHCCDVMSSANMQESQGAAAGTGYEVTTAAGAAPAPAPAVPAAAPAVASAPSLDVKKRQLQSIVIAKQLGIIKAQQERVRIQTEMSRDEKWLATSAKRTLIIVVVLLVSIVVWLTVRIITISRKYATMIHIVNQYGPRDMPSNIPFASRGFNCAVACEYPALTGVLGYLNGGFPYAMYISVYSNTLSACFMKNPQAYTAVMWSFSQLGQNNVKAGSTTASLAIVCQSWGLCAGITECENPCPPSACPKWYDYATSAVSTLNMGVMIGSFFPPFGTAVGAVIGLGAGLAITATTSGASCKADTSHCIPISQLA